MITNPPALNLRVGELVEVLSEEEILATLDEKGEYENLPFMPEMVKYCGQRLTVHKVAHKLCDPVTRSGMRRMENAVHLTGARCDGAAHGGCQTACSIYWKEAWLKRVSKDTPPTQAEPTKKLLPLLEVNARKEPTEDGDLRYRCQATEMLRASPSVLPVREFGQYVKDVRSGNAGVPATLRGMYIGFYNRYQGVSRSKLPRPLRIKGGRKFAGFDGKAVGATPVETLDLQPGELVRIKPREEIIKTLNKDLLNRGMGFEEEMARFCGRTARVRVRVDTVVDEHDGRLLKMKTPCVILEDVVCPGFYSVNCPREYVPFWREIWLERVAE